jgi:hypothetical protein
MNARIKYTLLHLVVRGPMQAPPSEYITVLVTRLYIMNGSQIRPFIENEESFRKIGHGGCTWNSIPRTTTVTDFRFFF